MRILTSWWLTRWSGAEGLARATGTSVDRIRYIGGYLGFALGEGPGSCTACVEPAGLWVSCCPQLPLRPTLRLNLPAPILVQALRC